MRRVLGGLLVIAVMSSPASPHPAILASSPIAPPDACSLSRLIEDETGERIASQGPDTDFVIWSTGSCLWTFEDPDALVIINVGTSDMYGTQFPMYSLFASPPVDLAERWHWWPAWNGWDGALLAATADGAVDVDISLGGRQDAQRLAKDLAEQLLGPMPSPMRSDTGAETLVQYTTIGEATSGDVHDVTGGTWSVTWDSDCPSARVAWSAYTDIDATDTYPLFDIAVDGESGSREVELPEGKGYLTVQPCDPLTMFLLILKQADD